MALKKLGLIGAGLVAAACSGEQGLGEANTDTADEGIIRSTALGGRNEVVLVVAKKIINGSVVEIACSGSYFAPRVVLTAAHCLQDVWAGQAFVYWGDDYFTDRSELSVLGDTLIPPPVGSPSHWAQADSFETHPSWDPALKYPDMGVIYLDRKPPFDPLPLARFRLDNSWLNKTVTISGWGYGVATGPVSGTGAYIQRTGRTKLLGSPTVADYHPDDPNPGMLVPAVRNNVIKIDGRAPNSNGCFGDSGSPIIINQWGQDYIAGVDYFGGFYCEDYSLYTRIEPFLPFLDQAYKKGGQETLIPHLNCIAPNQHGTLTAYFGFNNKNGVALTVPYGSKNQLALDTRGWRLTRFVPSKVDFAFGVDFTQNQTLTYSLAPDNSPRTTINVTKNSPMCGPDKALEVSCGNYCRSGKLSGCPNLPAFDSCMSGCVSEKQALTEAAPQCTTELDEYYSCYENTSGAQNWVCQDGYLPYAPGCDGLFYDWLGCAGFL